VTPAVKKTLFNFAIPDSFYDVKFHIFWCLEFGNTRLLPIVTHHTISSITVALAYVSQKHCKPK